MSDFRPAVLLTLQHEGGYVNNPNDRGGATKYGITQADMPGKDIADLSEDDAVAYYAAHYWKPSYSHIENQDVANKVFDMAVLFGTGEAAYLLQRALNFAADKWTKVFDDETLLAANADEPEHLLAQYRIHLEAHARNIVAANEHDQEFLNGWIRRIDS